MRLRTLLVVTVVAGLLLTPSAAFAGRWFSGIDLQGRYLGIGESLTFRSEVMFRNLEDAERARDSGEFHAYLVRGIDHRALNEATLVAEPKHWWSPPKELRLIGDVRLSKWNANLAVATAEIDVPEVTPGSYTLMLCNLGCSRPLGNLFPLQVRVSPDALTAQTARKLERTNLQFDLTLARVRRDVRRNNRQLHAMTVASADSAEVIARLQDKISSLETEAPSTPWLLHMLFFLAGTAAVLVARRSGRRVRPASPDPLALRAPDDARELISNR